VFFPRLKTAMLDSLLSDWMFQVYGLAVCSRVSCLFVLLAALIPLGLPRHPAVSSAAS
jgi:hypothetical protein